jgi:hypothetical protein
MKKGNFILVQDVENRGVGNVENAFADNTLMHGRVAGLLKQRRVMMLGVVNRRKVLIRTITAVVGTIAIVQSDGKRSDRKWNDRKRSFYKICWVL